MDSSDALFKALSKPETVSGPETDSVLQAQDVTFS